MGKNAIFNVRDIIYFGAQYSIIAILGVIKKDNAVTLTSLIRPQNNKTLLRPLIFKSWGNYSQKDYGQYIISDVRAIIYFGANYSIIAILGVIEKE